MEAWFIATGEYGKLRLFESQMQSQLFNVNHTDAYGKKMTQSMYGILEPVQLYRYIFPKEGEGIVLKTLADNASYLISKIPRYLSKKALGLREPDLKKFEKMNIKMPVETDWLRILMLGIRDDPEGVTANGIQQEQL